MPKFPIKNPMPRSLYGRAALILLLPIITLQLVVSFVFIQRLYEDVSEQMTQNIAVEIDLLLDVAARDGDADQTARTLQMRLETVADPAPDSRRFYDLSGRVIRRVLTERFARLRAVDLVSDRKAVTVSIEAGDAIRNVTFPRSRVTATNPHQLLVVMLFTGLFMSLIAIVFLRNQLRPIRRLARAADAFGKGQVDPYQPRGAIEVRAAGNAFLAMRGRIERQIEQRTLMLSGVSHDLRTPLTRLKLGLSMMEDTADSRALIGDVNEMGRLIDSFLDFARTDAVEDLEDVDPVTLARDLVELAVRAGGDATLIGDPLEGIHVKLRSLAVSRAVENLIGNALRYGSMARVSVDILDKSVRFRVEDNGPGIPADKRAEAMKPFARLDAARNQNKGSGVGLGLAITADIARSHGGSLRLQDSEEFGGLCADLVLPR